MDLYRVIRQFRQSKAAAVLSMRGFWAVASVVVFITTYMLILPAITKSTDTYCGKDEHVHDDSCYTVERTLICTEEEVEAHTHDDSCYTEKDVLVCGQKEVEAHTHDDSCYTENTELVCELEENEEHTHTAECYETHRTRTCGKKEREGHTHTAECYEKELELTCGKEETEGHTHTDSCYKEEKTFTCKKEEHEHTTICYSNPKADVETAKVWKKTVKDAKLTGKWSEDVLTIAKTQLGYHESTKNYIVNEKGKKKGYSRYGDWYGNSYGDWCAMYVSFCLNYANIPTTADSAVKQDGEKYYFPIQAGCQRWIELLNREETPYYYAVNDHNSYSLINDSTGFEPEAGNLIFFNWDKEADADHVGLVIGVDRDEDGKITQVNTIEGNSSDQVRYKSYKVSDSNIMGYAVIPENPNYVEPETEEMISRTVDGEDYHITLTYGEEAGIPEDAEVQVRELEGREYAQRCEEARDAMGISIISFARFFDITFVVNGEEIEPAATVEVKITYDEPVEIGEDEIGKAIHFAEDGTEVLDMVEEQTDDGTTFTFEQDSFSVTGTVSGVSTLADEGISTLADVNSDNAPSVGAVTGTHVTSPTVGEWYILYGYISGDVKYGPGQAIAASSPTDMVPLNQVSNDGGTVAYNGVMDLAWQYTENGFRNRNGEYLTITYYEANDTAQLGTSTSTTNANVKYNNNYHILYNTQVVDGSTKYNKIYMHENQGIIEGVMQDYLGTISSTAPPIYIARLTYDGSESGESGGSSTDTADANHPQCALTGRPDLENLVLYSMYADDSGLLAVPGVVYTVYDSNGKAVTSLETTDSYGLFLGDLPAGTYTVKQTSVPAGYVLNPEVKSFTVNADGYAFIGIFYVFKENENDFDADKTAQVVDYVNRIYQVTLNTKSGAYKFDMEAINYSLVVDQSNSMLFPAELTETGKTVTFNQKSITASNGWFSGCYIDTSGNLLEAQDGRGNVYGYVTYDKINSRWVVSWRCKIDGTHTTLNTQYSTKNWWGQDVISSLNTTVSGKTINHSDFTVGTVNTAATNNGILDNLNLDKKKVYYIIADETTTSTVYALWHNGEGWIYQDAAYYAKAQFTIAGLPNSTEAGGAVTYAQYNSGYSVGTAYGGGDIDTGLGGALLDDIKNGKNFKIYTGSQYNRLHELQQAVAAFATQLASLNENATLDLVTFDKEVESCYENIQLNPDNVKTVIGYVNGITTSGGTRQEKALRHLIGTHGGNGSANHTENHLSDGGTDIVILITDGAPVRSSGDTAIVTDDLINAGNEIEAAGVELTITVGLSMKNVQYGTQQLKGTATTEDWYYPSETTGELTDILVKNILFKLGKKTLLESEADIKDVISDSFYITDKDGNALSAGTRISLTGDPDSNGPGLICCDADKNEWYVKWDDQTLGTGTAGNTVYTYTDDSGTSQIIDPNTVYYINYWSNRSISGSGSDDDAKDRLKYVNGQWIYHWRTYNGDSNRTDSVGTRVTAGTTASPGWKGNIYLKAKEDFIGGNTIDTNKSATVTLQDTSGASASKGISLPTPTVNVRLLEMEGFESEETLFLGDDVTDIREKIQTLLEKTVIEKIKEGTGNQLNYKEGATEDNGCYTDHFTIPYAIRDLTEAEWTKLMNGENVSIDYTYDDASSHGAVGYFTFSLKNEAIEGETSSYDDHDTAKTGEDVEKYTLTVTYTAYRIGESDEDENQRKTNVHNGANGPGTEVGTGSDIPHGAGTESVDEVHHVHVIDGEIFVTKIIDESLKSDKDQTYIFNLYVVDPESGKASETIFKTVTATVKAGEATGTIRIGNLPRNRYLLKEADSTEYRVDKVEVVDKTTNCVYDNADPDLEFDIGTNEASNGTDHNVIIYNETSPNWEDSLWENEQRYVYSKPFTQVDQGANAGEGSGSDDSGSGNTEGSTTTPGTHLEPVERTVYDCSSGAIISTSISDTTYEVLNSTSAVLDEQHTSYGILTQDTSNKDNWTIEWHTWTSNEESSTSYDWPSGTIITSDISGSQYVKSSQTQAQLNDAHTDYGILTQVNGDQWTVEWHRWSSREETTTTPSGDTVTVTFYKWWYDENVDTSITVPANQATTITYTCNQTNAIPRWWNNTEGHAKYQAEQLTKTAVSGSADTYTITLTPTTDTFVCFSSEYSTSGSYISHTGGTSTTSIIWSEATSTEAADSTMIPTTTTNLTHWSVSTRTEKAESSKIPTKKVTEYIEVPDETTDSESDEEVIDVTITTLSAGHGKIYNTERVYEALIPVKKIWDDGGDHKKDAVYVILYKNNSLITDEDGNAMMLKLNNQNNFSGEYTVSAPNENYEPLQDGYEIREVNDMRTVDFRDSFAAVVVNDDSDKTVYHVKVAEENGLVTVNNSSYNAHYYTDSEGNKLVVKNNKAYELPKTGGIGTTLFTLAGLLLMTGSALMLFLKHKGKMGRL